MSRLLIIGVLLSSALTLHAQAQQPNTAKLKADAQKVVSIIRGDKAETQAYCQINSLGGEVDMAAQAKDEQKADVLTKKINELEKQLGPEYLALFDALNNADQELEGFSGHPFDVRFARPILYALGRTAEQSGKRHNRQN